MHLKSLSRLVQLLLLTAVVFAGHHKILHKISKRTHRHLEDKKPAAVQNTTATANPATPAGPKGDLKCNPKVPQLFNLTGTGNLSSSVFLDVCGLSTQSCCTLKDQEKIVETWNAEGVGFNLKDRMEFHKKLVRDVYEEALNVVKRAKQVLEPNKKPSPECLFMARRIDALSIYEIFPRIANNFARMHEFILTSYKGLQCAACDPTTNSQFDLGKKEVNLSPKFCRDLISNSLNASLYNHKHTPVIANLMVVFLDTCNAEGVFQQPPTPKKSPLIPNNKHEKELDRCKKNRNSPFWLESCVTFCQQFKVGQFDAFFEPEIKTYSQFARFLQTMVTSFDAKTANSTAVPQKAQSGAPNAPGVPPVANNAQTPPATTNNPQQPPAPNAPVAGKRSRKLRHRQTQRILNVQSGATNVTPANPNNPQTTPANPNSPQTPLANGQEPSEDAALERYLKRSIFPPNGTTPHKIEQFVTKISPKGIDLYKFGNFADLNSATVQSAKTVQKVDAGVKTRARARKLKSASVWKSVGTVLAMFLIMS
jgi:hypothetical protein